MKKVLITGGSRGIGRACVSAFTERGYDVAFIYKTNIEKATELAKETGAVPICADISVPNEVKTAVRTAAERLGGVDILINNAGISEFSLFTDISDEMWTGMINTNLSGAFYVTRETLPFMIHEKRGRIINIGSVWGRVGASCEVHYSAAKAGIRGLTFALAKEVAPSGITVNCIEPGVIDTDMNAMLDEDTKAELREEIPIGRWGRADEVAALALFLASDGAGYITGQAIGVDGGYHL